jgi:hypothetical protein
MTALFRNSRLQAVGDGAAAAARREGLSSEEIAQIEESAKRDVLPLFDGFGLEPHQMRDLTDLATRLALDRRAGRMTDAKVAAWSQLVREDLRSRHASNRRVAQILREANQRLFDEKPDAYAGLARSAKVGFHPMAARLITDWHLRREADEAAATRASKFMKGSGASVLPAAPVVEVGAGE